MGIREDLIKTSQQIFNNAGIRKQTPTIIAESKRQEWIDNYGQEQVDKWIENEEIMFIPVPPVALDFVNSQFDIQTDKKIKEIINGTNDNRTMEQNETKKKETL